MRHIFRNFVIAALVLAPLSVAAQSVDLTALTAQIASLQAQIAAQIQAQQGGQQSSVPSGGGNCVELSRSLSKGDSGEDVTDLQKFLISEGYLEDGKATGFFGTLTETAVKQWQSAHGIEPLGIVGPKTRAAMAVCGAAPAQPPGPTLISNQCPNVQKPAVCENGVSVQQNGCTVGWQCSVTNLPAQTFTASPTSGTAPFTVKFSGVVTSANAGFCQGNFCAATLVFGDGSTGAVPLPNAAGASLTYEINHTYTTGGQFVANLYQGPAGSGAPHVGNGIAITSAPPIVVIPTGPTITASPNSGVAPLAVNFIVTNVTSGANLSVEFGDGSFGSLQQVGNALGTSHTYITGGSYTVKLRRVNSAGESCTSASCQVIASTGLTVGGAQVANAALVANPSTGLAPLPVQFFSNAASVSYAGGVVLDFGDNSTEIICAGGVLCNQKTSTHTYAAAGTYNVQLLGLGPNGTTIIRTATVIAVSPQASSLKADVPNGPVPHTVVFTGHGGNQPFVNGVILKYGDDTSETFCTSNELCGQKTKTHIYNDGSQYPAQLIGLGVGNASTTLGSVVITATGGPTKIKITAPMGTWRKGDSVPLIWKIFGTKPTTGSLSFDLYTQTGTRIGTILTITNFLSGAATWKIPSSQDKSCVSTQPNGLCGVNLKPGMYKIVGYTTGVTGSPEVVSDAVIEIKDEVITPSGFTISAAPSTVERGRPMTIKYRVANPPFDSGVALWLVDSTGNEIGVIDAKLDADTELTTYPWDAAMVLECPQRLYNLQANCASAIRTFTPGTYYVMGKVYTPFTTSPIAGATTSATIHAMATSSAFTIKQPGTGASCTVLTRNLGPGDTDPNTDYQVSVLQQFLAEDSDIYPEGTISGFYGPATRRAVERYQAANGIASSGSPETNGYGAVGPSTRASIATKCSGNSSYLFRATPLSGRAPLSVTFTAKVPGPGVGIEGAAGAPQAMSIDFGDGMNAAMQIATSTNPDGTLTISASHIYPTNGTYIAKLVTGGWACASALGSAPCTAPQNLVAGTVSVKVTNTTVPPPQTCAAISRVMNAEDTDAKTGGDVSRLQQFLAADSVLYPEGLVTGFYGPATGRAVARYQASKGIAQTGNVGPLTLTAIRCPVDGANELFSATPQTGAAPMLVRFATNQLVSTGSYRVKFGDEQSQWLSASSTTHTYPVAGTYTAELIQSVGNCYGTNGIALEICEIGNATVLATKTITVSPPAQMTLTVSPTTRARGDVLAINWTTQGAPAGSKIRLEVYRDGATEATGVANNDQGLTSGTSELPASGSFNWTIPTANTIALDGGFGGYVMAPGFYHITAKLYTGSACWGFCIGSNERTLSGVINSGSFEVKAGPSTGGGGAFPGSVDCVNTDFVGAKLKLTYANGATGEFIAESWDESHIGRHIVTQVDFPAKPTGGTMETRLGVGGTWMPLIARITGQTSASLTIAGGRGTGLPGMNTDTFTCVATWR